jgi:hypothetical protein
MAQSSKWRETILSSAWIILDGQVRPGQKEPIVKGSS